MIGFSDAGQKMGCATLVRHQGLVIALAADIETNQISYRVLNVKPSVPDDDQNWSGLKQLSFPTQIRPAGMGLVTREVGEVGTISKGAKAAFRACSDGRYVFVFRPSLDGTLLVDRFVFDPAMLILNPNIETRYQRSRKKDIPAGSKDSMGYEDMENQPFPEPTLELELSKGIKGGNFTVILLQTSISSEWRWLIIAGNDSKNQLDFFSIHRASDGLFDMGDVLETNISLATEGGQNVSPLVGLDALLYAEQESFKDDYGRSQRMKRGLRLMLAAAPQDANIPLAILDFAVTRDGGLTRVPDESRLTLPELDLDKNEAVLPSLYVDIQGTELRGGLLKPAYSKAAPFLMDGTDGLVHLYYPSRQTDALIEGQFMVAQYDTGMARARIELPLLPSEKGGAQMTALRPGAALNDAALTISAGDAPEHCTVVLAYVDGDGHKTQETWQDVPRRLDRFAAVLNGDTTPDTRDPRVKKGEMVAYDAALKRQFTSQRLAYLAYDLPAGIGAVRLETWQPVVQEQSGMIIAVSRGSKGDLCTVTLQLKVDPAETAKPVIETWQDVPRGVDDFIRLLSGLFTTDPQDPQVKDGSKLLYDAAAKAKSNNPEADLRSGSGLFKFQNRGASEEIQNQEIERRAFDHPGSLLFGVVTGISEVDAVLIQVNNVEQAVVGEAGFDACWIPEPLGHMLKFSQGSYLDIKQDQLPERDFQGDLSMEAWINPEVSSDGVQRILHMQRSEKTRCFFGLEQVTAQDKSSYFLAHAGSQNLKVLAKDIKKNRIHQGVWSHLAAVLNTSNTLDLDGKGYVDCGNEAALRLVDALTVEAWVEPKAANTAGVIASKWGSAEKDQSWKLSITSEGSPCFSVRDSVNGRTWQLMAKDKIKENVLTHLAGVFDVVPRRETALSLAGDPNQKQYVSMEGTGLKGVNPSHTIEAWLWLDEYPQKDKRAWILNLGKNNPGAGDHHWLVKSDGSTQLGPWDGVQAQHTSPLPLKQWTHVALCFDQKEGQLTCYFNGVQQGDPKQGAFILSSEKNQLRIGVVSIASSGKEQPYWKGKINNLRVWDRALSQEEVRENMFKKFSEVTGAVGSWAFDAVDKLSGKVEDRVGRNSGVLHNAPDFVEVDKGLYRMQLYVNGSCASWTWLCFSGGDYTLGQLLSDRDWKKESVLVNGTWPRLEVGDVLMVPDPGGTRGEEQIEVLSVKTMLIVDTSRPLPILQTKRPVHGTPAFKHGLWKGIDVTTNANVWVDTAGGDSRKNEFKLAKIADTETNVCIGAEASGTSAFQGLIDEVRVWNLGRSEAQIKAYINDPLPKSADGLVAWWPFDEGQGRRAEDLKGTSHGRLIHADEKVLKENKLWAPSTRNAHWSLYLNGKALEVENQEAQDQAARVQLLGDYGDAGQFRLASMASAGENTSFYSGSLDEVRLWKQVRSPEQVADNMYHDLDGKEEGLIAYWPLQEGQGEEVADQTGNGQHGKLAGTPEKPTWLRSTAPIGNESPLVRHVYGGLERVFNQVIASQPLVAEYGDLQFDANGELFGVMKRCYIYMAGEDIHITSGFKIGDLELHFIGQVQTAPTLVGYIEGAPPVPSENLTVNDPKTDDYVGNSSITLTEATDSVQIYSASRDTGFDMSVDIKAGLYVAGEATGGLGIQTQIFKAESKFGLHAYFEHSQSWLMGSQISSTASRSQANSLALGGSWEDEKRCLNPQVGRRYIPNNMGYALVKSATADLFALRLKRDGSLVAYQVLPNPDIPEDWNIIMFPLNPKYIKNGTLDGMVGLIADPDYPNAVEGERGSYFKPLEAYALKALLDRQAKQREGYYDRYNARTKTGYLTIGTDANPFSEVLPEEKGLGYDWAARSSKASLVNTYVWTADGGFFAEETQFSSTKQESKGGAYHFLGKGGVYTDFKLAVKVGAFVEADVLFGGHINTTLSQTREQTAAFGMSVNVIGEGYLNRWDRNSGHYASEPCPGKVDAYRFMTFYLAPELNHFNKFFSQVVDLNWLYERGPYTGQYLPNARALRQAIVNRNEVWRVMHRVTYVSRIPPESKETAVESKPKDVRRPDNVEGNAALIEEIEGTFYSLYPEERPELAGIAKLGEAVEMWLNEIQDKTWGKDLDPKSTDEAIRAYRQELRQDVLTYLKSYYELDKNALTGLVEKPTPPKPIGPSKPLPVWFISSPAPWSQVKGKVMIRGRVQGPKGTAALKYRLEFLGGGMASWKSLNLEGKSPKSGILGSLDTRKLEPGDYRLRLVIDGEGYKPFVVPFRVVK